MGYNIGRRSISLGIWDHDLLCCNVEEFLFKPRNSIEFTYSEVVYLSYVMMQRWSTCVLVCFSWLLIHVIYLKLKRELLLCKAEQTIITQNENLVHPRQFWVSFCEFAQLYTTVILFSAWDKSCDPAAKQAIAKYNGGKNIFEPQIVWKQYFCIRSGYFWALNLQSACWPGL